MGSFAEGQRSPEGLHEIVRRLHAGVWRLTRADECLSVLLELRGALVDLGMEEVTALVHVVEERGTEHAVRYRNLGRDSGWEWSSPDEQQPVVEVWQDGREARRAAAMSPVMPTSLAFASRRAGIDVQSLLEIPFSHGVLGLYSRHADTFSAPIQHCAEQLGLVLSVLFHRVSDLETLGSKERQLRHIQRLQLVGQLTAEVAQDLNDPLSVILGECDLLLEGELEPDVAEAVRAISGAGQQAQAVGHRLLDFVRGTKADKEWVNFNRLVQESVELIRRVFTKEQIELQEDLGRNLPWIQAHVGQVQQVVLNLLQNAREALVEHRSIGVVRVRTYAQKNRVFLEIEDNGPGVTPDIAERIFDPFFTTKDSSHGSGLGLSVCAGIAREHGGHISLESRLVGTCLALDLPVRQEHRFTSN
jgi:signal transduction histidine kinase